MKDKNKVIKKIVNSLNANDYEAAHKIIERDLKRLGEGEEYYFYLALITENLEKKRELYSKAIELKPDFLDAYINRGIVNNELQDYENRGYTKYKQKDYEGALKDYNKAILLNPKFQMAIDNKANLFLDICMEDEKDFIEKYYLSLGIADVNSGNFSEAIRSFDEVLKYNSSSDLAFFYKGIAYHSLGRDTEAYEFYTKAIDVNKKMTDAYFNRGQLILKENPKAAIDDFVAAIALDSKFIDAYYALAAVQKNLGLYEDALKNLDKIIALEPDAVNAKALKKLILTKYLKK